MDNKVKIGYISSTGKEGEFDIDIPEKTMQVLKSVNTPIDLIKNAGKLGVKGIGSFIMTILCFIILNIIFIISLLTLFAFGNTSLYNILAGLLAGILFVFISIKKAYAYVALNLIKTMYIKASPLFKKLCSKIVNKVADEVEKQKTPKTFTVTPLHITAIIKNDLAALPKFLKKGLTFLLKRLPLTKFMNNDILPLLLRGNKDEAARVLYTKADNYINQNIFSRNTLRWIFWMILLNILIQLFIIMIRF